MKTALLVWLALNLGFIFGAVWCGYFRREPDDLPTNETEGKHQHGLSK